MFMYDFEKNKMHLAGCRYVKPEATDKYGSLRYRPLDNRSAAASLVTVLNSWTCNSCNSYAAMVPGKGGK